MITITLISIVCIFPPGVKRHHEGTETVPGRRPLGGPARGDHPLSKPDVRILHALRQLSRILDINSRRLARERGVTSVQLFCLNTMVEDGTSTATSIAEKVHLSASTVVGILDRLEGKKFITRQRDADDRRVVRVSLTDEGRHVAVSTPHPVQDLLERKFNGLTRAKANGIALSLESLVNMLDGDKIDGDGPLGGLSDDREEM